MPTTLASALLAIVSAASNGAEDAALALAALAPVCQTEQPAPLFRAMDLADACAWLEDPAAFSSAWDN